MAKDKNERLDNEREHGRKISENAEEIWGWASPAGQERARRRANYFIDLGGFGPGDKVLEIGCGTGFFTERVWLATRADIVATDLSEDLLNVARSRLPKLRFQVEDAMALSFEAESFDAVYGSSVLHHLDMLVALQQIHRVLKPGGRMVFAEPNMANPQILVQKNVPIVKRWMGDSPDETAVVRWKMLNMLRRVGFEQAEVFPYDFLHPSVPKPLIGAVKRLGRLLEKTPLLKEIAGSVIITAKK